MRVNNVPLSGDSGAATIFFFFRALFPHSGSVRGRKDKESLSMTALMNRDKVE